MSYLDFLSRKMVLAQPSGFEPGPVHPLLKPHQRDIVQWAIRGGRRAIFARFGLGKTFIQLEVLRQVLEHEGGRQLVIAPLGV
ncbi:hypothetical protein, partial [Solidesulfovibrio sp.]|uniref:hypothetical protein n=1 Tax=Solidesulfovibrio sp. TaxID=2910990 RepID=UPI002B215BC2